MAPETEEALQALPPGSTVDAFAGGRVEMVQMADGSHRCGLEAALLGASIERAFAGRIVELGAGSGAAGLMVAARCPKARIALVDRDRAALGCARAALARPANVAFAHRVEVIEVDICDTESGRIDAGLARMTADAVIANPPFYNYEKHFASPNLDKRSAHLLEQSGIEPWVRCSASVLKPGGQLVFIVAADLLASVLDRLSRGFGGVDLLPIHARASRPARRVLLSAIKDSRADLRLLPPLILHGPTGSTYLPGVDTLLRGAAGLGDIHPAWGKGRTGRYS